MPRLLSQACVLALAFSAPLFAAETVSKAQVLEAIRSFDANSTGSLTAAKPVRDMDDAVAKASNTILRYSLESDDVVVDLGNASVPWCDVKKGLSAAQNSGARGLLLAAYLSGSVKAQLATGKQDPNPYAGWVAMLRLYHTMRIREDVRIPEIDALLARQADGTLEAYAAAAVQRSTDALRKAYGQPEGSSRSIVTAAAQP
jgi:hypothetical protein